MSLFANISLLNNALRTFQTALNVTSNNIANAATPGYSRQVAGLQTLPVIYDGSAFGLGSGVGITGIQRVRDAFLDARIKFELSELGRASTKKEVLTELAAIFPEVVNAGATNGLKAAIDTVVNKWTALAAAPTSVSAKTEVRDALSALAVMLQKNARKTFDLQLKVDDQVRLTINEINTYADQIASLNRQLKTLGASAYTGNGNALLDLREQAAEKLAKLIDANFIIAADGSMTVSFSTGTLVQGEHAYHLIGIPSPNDPGRTAIGYTQIMGAAARNVTASIRGGKLGALLDVRDGAIERARLDLNRIAFGIISRSNEINRTYTAGDGTTNHDLFVGNSAADIQINPIVAANPDYVGGTRDTAVPGDLALFQSQLKDFIQFSSMRTAPGSSLGGGFNVDPNNTIAAQAVIGLAVAPTAASGQFVISTGGNNVYVNWNNGMTLNQIIALINSNGAGAFYATFDDTNDKLIIAGEKPMTIYDISGNFAEMMMLSSVVQSSAPINNYPVPGQNLVDPNAPFNSIQNTLNIYSAPVPTGGTVLIDGTPINWTAADDIQLTLALNINLATPSPRKVGLTWDPNTQTVSLIKSGDPTQNPGALDWSLGNSMNAIQIVDQKGNLTRVLNLDTDTNASKILDELLVDLGSGIATETVLEQQAQALVDQTTALQSAQASVDLNAELAQARLYQRSYEASVRMQFILDEILNVLINRTGTSSTTTSV
jgi:flagellar hook-associated protein 1 FlgK